MQCEFCREQIAADALICPHCRKKTVLGRKGDIGCGPALLWLAGIVIVVFIALAIIGGQMPQETTMQRIERSCRDQYPYDETARMTCQNTLMLRALQNSEDDKLRSAARQAGVR